MKKIALSACILFSLILSSVGFLPGSRVIACSVREPETLLSLYVESDFIYRARYVGEEAGKPEDDGEGTVITEYKQTFEPLETFKGKPRDSFNLFYSRYDYTPPPDESAEAEPTEKPVEDPEESETEPAIETEEEVAAEHEEEESEEEPEMKPGDIVLMFVRNDKESGRLELTDYDGIKTLAAQDRAIYEARIKELASIMAKEKPDVDKVLDWLVALAEDKVTRWEGTYELERSFRTFQYEKARSEEEKKADIEAEAEMKPKRFGMGGTSELARALTEYHRQRLTNLFISTRSERTPDGKAVEAVNGDYELTQLVTRWPDQRIAPALLAQVREGGTAYWQMSQAMQALATILRDKRLEELSTKFESLMYEGDDQPAEVEESAAVTTTVKRRALTNAELRTKVLTEFLKRASNASGETPSKTEVAPEAPVAEKQKAEAVKTTAVRIVD